MDYRAKMSEIDASQIGRSKGVFTSTKAGKINL